MRIDGNAPSLTATTLAAEGETSIGKDAAPSAESVDFSALLKGSLDETKRLHAEAATKVDALGRGASDDLHGTMITVKEAEISMKLVGSVRNRLLDAFNELWRINL